MTSSIRRAALERWLIVATELLDEQNGLLGPEPSVRPRPDKRVRLRPGREPRPDEKPPAVVPAEASSRDAGSDLDAARRRRMRRDAASLGEVLLSVWQPDQPLRDDGDVA